MAKPTYPLTAREVKKVINLVLAGKKYDNDQFMYYHKHRNYFNVKSEVTHLIHFNGKVYLDNLGKFWTEQPVIKNLFHMPKGNYALSMMGLTKPHSRKFLRPDHETGVGGEFEIIVRHDGRRIDSLTNTEYQETYNFGKTDNSSQHKKLDVDPHFKNPNYVIYGAMGKVEIRE